MSAREIEFFFDVGSSYSYLAAHQVDDVAARAGVPVRWRPFLLGGVLKATGNPMPASVPAKARWMVSDMQRWAGELGLPFRVPSRFPLVTLRTQRALAAAELARPDAVPAFARGLFRAYWGEDADPTTDATLTAHARAAGLDADAIVAAIDAPATKDHLRTSTDEAVRRGAFGAPSMFVGDALFWGNDRLPLLERFLSSTR